MTDVVSWKDLKSELKNCTQSQLLDLLGELYDLNVTNRHFLQARYTRCEVSLESYKKTIRKALHPGFGHPLRLSEGRKAIREYKKAAGNPKNLLELMVYYVECGNGFTLEYGDIDEPFYNSLISMFSEIVKYLITAQDQYLLSLFLPRLQNIVHKASGMGWGYYDELAFHLAELEKTPVE